MSTEAEVTEALNQPVDNNAQAADDAKKMLEELSGEGATNGTAEKSDEKPAEKDTNGTSEEKPEDDDEKRDRSPEYRRNNRGDRDRGRGRGRGGGRGRGSYGGGRDTRNNIKSDLTTQEESDDPVAIRKQVEFYFSDSNLPRDKFLLEQVGGSKNNPVELKTLHSFKRMRHFQPFEAIVNAMRESTFLELCEDDTCVRRKEPLPAELDNGPDPKAVQIFEDRAMPRSIYAKGFGEETPSTQFDIEAFFAEHGTTNAVRLRRAEDKTFKGSVFVEFDSEATAQKFLELDPKPAFEGKELQIMSKKEYCEKKVDDIKAGRMKPNRQYEKPRYDRDRRGGRGGRDGGRDFKRKRDDEDDRDWRVRRDEDRKSGFRDGRGKHDRDNKGHGRHDSKYEKAQKDDRGIPAVRSTDDKDSAKADALANAKAAVEAETAKEATAGQKREREEDEGDAERETKKVDTKEVEAAA